MWSAKWSSTWKGSLITTETTASRPITRLCWFLFRLRSCLLSELVTQVYPWQCDVNWFPFLASGSKLSTFRVACFGRSLICLPHHHPLPSHSPSSIAHLIQKMAIHREPRRSSRERPPLRALQAKVQQITTTIKSVATQKAKVTPPLPPLPILLILSDCNSNA